MPKRCTTSRHQPCRGPPIRMKQPSCSGPAERDFLPQAGKGHLNRTVASSPIMPRRRPGSFPQVGGQACATPCGSIAIRTSFPCHNKPIGSLAGTASGKAAQGANELCLTQPLSTSDHSSRPEAGPWSRPAVSALPRKRPAAARCELARHRISGHMSIRMEKAGRSRSGPFRKILPCRGAGS